MADLSGRVFNSGVQIVRLNCGTDQAQKDVCAAFNTLENLIEHFDVNNPIDPFVSAAAEAENDLLAVEDECKQSSVDEKFVSDLNLCCDKFRTFSKLLTDLKNRMNDTQIHNDFTVLSFTPLPGERWTDVNRALGAFKG